MLARSKQKEVVRIALLLATLGCTGAVYAQFVPAPKETVGAPAPSPGAIVGRAPLVTPQSSPTPAATVYRDMVSQHSITLVVGTIAGIIAVLPWLYAYKQRRDQFERKEQRDQFADIQDRFVSADHAMRASVILRLAEFGRCVYPGAFKWPWQPYPTFNEHNFPFFRPVVAQLATALHRERDSDIRATLKKALESLSAFARQENNYLLQRELIRELADANIAAENTFIRALARYEATCVDFSEEARWTNTKLTTATLPFKNASENKGIAAAYLTKLTYYPAYGSELRIARDLHHRQSTSEQWVEHEQRFAELQSAGAILVDTHHVLVRALREWVPAPAKLPQQPEFDRLHQRCLVGADLTEVNLNGASLRGAYLSSALLEKASLKGADLNGADLNEAKLGKANLSGADIRWAKLSRVFLGWADLSGTKLCSSDLSGAELPRADLTGADLSNANLSEAVLSLADLDKTDLSEANLNGAWCYHLHNYQSAIGLPEALIQSSGSGRITLRFTPRFSFISNPKSDVRTEEFLIWLKQEHPDAYAVLEPECLDEWEAYKKKRAEEGFPVTLTS